VRTAFSAFLLAVLTAPGLAFAQTATPDKGDTAWVLISSALVLLMLLPGLGLFYGGLVRAKNILSVVMHCFIIACTVSLLWAVVGYSLVFSDGNGVLGGLSQVMLRNMAAMRTGLTVPENVFALYQMTFAIITPALMVGAFVERVRFGWMTAFTLAWAAFVYVPVARWMWGGGWLASQFGALDFAGGIVVHTTAGVGALLIALLLGPRKGFNRTLLTPHSPALTMVGAGLLWVGWYGFNGGSALTASADAGSAILNTHLAACTAALLWIGIEYKKIGKPTSVGLVTGAVAGLATVTPAAGFIGPLGAMLFGLLGSAICYVGVQLIKSRLKIDDSLDVFAVHGVGGMLGSLLLPVGMLPLLGGKGFAEGVTLTSQLGAQALAVVVVALWTLVVTWVLAKGLALYFSMRVDQESEHDGLDISSHGERGWDFN
jgi:ammonium transporter, Amt family